MGHTAWGQWSSSPSPLSLSLEGQVGACHHGHLTPVSPLAFPVTCSFSDTHILLGSFSSRGLRSTGPSLLQIKLELGKADAEVAYVRMHLFVEKKCP